MQYAAAHLVSNKLKQLRMRLDAGAAAQTEADQRELQNVLKFAAPGGHLRSVVALYAADHKKLQDSYSQVRNCIEMRLPGLKVHAFGSLITGLALKGCDMDLYVEVPADPSKSWSNKYTVVADFIQNTNDFADVVLIRHARVPLIRCKHLPTGLAIDINVSDVNGVMNSMFIADLIKRDERLLHLFIFIKIWAQKMNLFGDGKLTSYCLNTMIIVSLQQYGLMPTIKEMQLSCPEKITCGINYAYNIESVPPIPEHTTILQLARNFFSFYKDIGFEKSVVSPLLGCVMDRQLMLGGIIPEYTAQMLAKQEAGVAHHPPSPSQKVSCMHVQDSFELHNNVAESVSPSTLDRLRKCLSLAAEATKDLKLLGHPETLFDLILLGPVDKLVANQEDNDDDDGEPLIAKQIKRDPWLGALVQPKANPAATCNNMWPFLRPKVIPATQMKMELGLELPVQPEATNPAATFTAMLPTSIIPATQIKKPRLKTPVQPRPNPMAPTERTTLITATVKQLRTLGRIVPNLRTGGNSMSYFWMLCYVDTITFVLTNIYGLDMELVVDEPLHHMWYISASVDTWTGRNYNRDKGVSFLAHQMHQTCKFLAHGARVNVRGNMWVVANEANDQLEVKFQSLSGDVLSMCRNSHLAKLYRSSTHTITCFSFVEVAKLWKKNNQV